ncbi:MAG TPA: LON peptidase substrate-binding domain-containing protein [Polyangiaceae bacterium]|nr:LON peptidase substrate-binding domain-containing protein [Polyangiaceae bacterium]
MSFSGLVERDLAALPLFPLPNVVLFPGALLPLHVFEPRYRELVREVLAGRKLMGIVRLKPGFEEDYEGRPPVFDICGIGAVIDSAEHADGRFDITLRGLARARILEELPPNRAFREFRLEELNDGFSDAGVTSAWQRKLISLWSNLSPHLPEPVRDLRALTRGAEGAGAFADRIAAALVGDPDSSQRLLAETDPTERLRLLAEKLQQVHDSVAPPSAARRSELN